MSYTKITNVDRWLEKQPAEVLEQLAKHPLIADLYKAKVKQYKTHKPRPVKAPAGLTCTWLDSTTLRLTPEPPSANMIKAWLYNKRAKHRYAAYRVDLRDALLRERVLYRQNHPLTITHTWVTVQPRDEDSFGTSLKPVLDALVDAGILASDDPAHVSLQYGGQTSGGKGIHGRRGLTLTFGPRSAAPTTDLSGGRPSGGSSSLPHGNR